jgi:hypothetical protein
VIPLDGGLKRRPASRIAPFVPTDLVASHTKSVIWWAAEAVAQESMRMTVPLPLTAEQIERTRAPLERATMLPGASAGAT